MPTKGTLLIGLPLVCDKLRFLNNKHLQCVISKNCDIGLMLKSISNAYLGNYWFKLPNVNTNLYDFITLCIYYVMTLRKTCTCMVLWI
jgi:hypothetical protein